MKSSDLITDIWNRRRELEWSVRMSVKQVNFFISLLERERIAPPTRQHCYPIYGLKDAPPLEVVVYPNGAGFVRVQQWALVPDNTVPSKWRLKTEEELAKERANRN